MEGKNIFTDEVHIHLLQLPAERERQEWSWQEGGRAARGCDSRQPARRPDPSPHMPGRGLWLSVLGTLLKSDCSLVEEKQRKRRRRGLQQKPEAWKGRTREKCQGGEEGAEEGGGGSA